MGAHLGRPGKGLDGILVPNMDFLTGLTPACPIADASSHADLNAQWQLPRTLIDAAQQPPTVAAIIAMTPGGAFCFSQDARDEGKVPTAKAFLQPINCGKRFGLALAPGMVGRGLQSWPRITRRLCRPAYQVLEPHVPQFLFLTRSRT